ncbi:hypothetical protein ABPG72_002571, partial [Tetrahymena utriculariae]
IKFPIIHLTDCTCDFEKALFNALKITFSKCDIFGCLFHLAQNIWKKASEIGLKKQEVIQQTFLVTSSLLLLSFLPIEQMPIEFNRIKDEFIEQPLFIELLDYYDQYWLQERNCNIEMINFTRQIHQLKYFCRSNNNIESFHSTLLSRLQKNHRPSINSLIEQLIEIEYNKANQWGNYNYHDKQKTHKGEFYMGYLKKLMKSYFLLKSKDGLNQEQISKFCQKFTVKDIDKISSILEEFNSNQEDQEISIDKNDLSQNNDSQDGYKLHCQSNLEEDLDNQNQSNSSISLLKDDDEEEEEPKSNIDILGNLYSNGDILIYGIAIVREEITSQNILI